jgi:hypothetical protein
MLSLQESAVRHAWVWNTMLQPNYVELLMELADGSYVGLTSGGCLVVDGQLDVVADVNYDLKGLKHIHFERYWSKVL